MTAVVAFFRLGPFGPAAGPRRLALGASRPGGLNGWAVVHHVGGRYLVTSIGRVFLQGLALLALDLILTPKAR
jgi:hypothetical protein